MRTLILGATGQIGSQLVAACDDRGYVTAGTYYRRPLADFAPLDLRDEETVRDVIADVQPDVVFLAAGLTQIDYAERFPLEAAEVCVGGTELVARAAADAGAELVLFTSAHVFGECGTARKEDAQTDPVNVFGKSQAAAEQVVRGELPGRHLIVRTSHVFGPEERGRNPAPHVVRRLRDGMPVFAASDRLCQPTYGPDLAAAAVTLLADGVRGTVHAVGPDRQTEFQFAQLVAFIYGYDADLVIPTPAAELGEDAPRANTHWLDRSAARRRLGPQAFRRPADALRHLRDTAFEPAVAARAA